MDRYFAEVTTHQSPTGLQIHEVQLRCMDGDRERLCVSVFPELGFKSAGLRYKGIAVQPDSESWREMLLRSAFIGSPLMFPTPNRVRNGRFSFNGETLEMIKHGSKRDNHGLVYDSVWEWEPPKVGDHSVSVCASIEFKPGDDNYRAYPYPCRLKVCYEIVERGLNLSYCLENLGERPMPFGFGAHPYFLTGDPEDHVRLRLQAKSIYELTEEKLPTGKLICVQGDPIYDLNRPRMAADLCMDVGYTHLSPVPIVLAYPKYGFQMEIAATNEFKVVQIFTPNTLGMLPSGAQPMIAIENQTGCADAINMAGKGFAESGLLVLEPHEKKEGRIAYHFSEI